MPSRSQESYRYALSPEAKEALHRLPRWVNKGFFLSKVITGKTELRVYVDEATFPKSRKVIERSKAVIEAVERVRQYEFR